MITNKKKTKDHAMTDNQRAPNYFTGDPFKKTRDHLAAVGERLEWLRDFYGAPGSPADELAQWSPSLERLDKALYKFAKVLSKWEFKNSRKKLEEQLFDLERFREYTKESVTLWGDTFEDLDLL